MPIPKIIHFIWAGGDKLLPEENSHRIKAWAAKNPDFKVYLWIDKLTTSQEQINEYYSRYLFNHNPKIILKDINEENVVDEYSRYHIGKLRPNYGASSDTLRYKILIKIGGAYFDSDIIVTENTKPLNHDGLFDSNENEILRITHFTQNHHAIGNDAFICSPNHPFMIELYETVKKNHQLQAGIYSNLCNDFMNWTIGTTGPMVVVQVCLKLDMLEKTDISKIDNSIETTSHNNITYYQKTKDTSLKLDTSCYQCLTSNDKNWLMASPRKCNDVDEAINITLESIYFEIKYMGMLRIDDHVRNIIKTLSLKSTIYESGWSCNDPTQEEIQIADKLVQALNQSKINFTHCKMIQLITRYQTVADFYRNFTPMLNDNDVDDSATAINKVSNRCTKETKEMIIKNYLTHLRYQSQNGVNNNELMRTHILNFIENYIDDGEDLFLAKDTLLILDKDILSNQNIEWLTALINLQNKIIINVINKTPHLELELKKMIFEHLVNYPEHKDTIVHTLYVLSQNTLYSLPEKPLIFNSKVVIVDNDESKLLYQLHNKIVNDLKHPYKNLNGNTKVSSLSLFHLAKLSSSQSSEAIECEKITLFST